MPPAPGAAPAGSTAPVRILGLDPGSLRTGFGLIDCLGPRCVYVHHGVVRAGSGGLPERLRVIFEAVQALMGEFRPDEVAIERVFVNRNADSAIKLGQARGAVLAAVPRGTAVFEYAPRAIKLAVVGSGAADKPQVAHMMHALLGLTALAADAADALAAAMCHAHSRRAQQLSGGVPVPAARVPRAE
ncbi:MAG TPA: crossover junction endodeoxyribonuclease RuvC [Steroidobacteraceae bacterium]|nr:crossover junction endodeoxyribonuclease RuvC [Steroidobacteraceae bacterium]